MPRHRRTPLVPSRQDAMLAQMVSRALDEQRDGGQAVRVQIAKAGRKTTTFELPSIAARLLQDALRDVAAGKAVTLVPVDVEITTQQAADLLNVSRPFLVGIVDDGTLHARMIGNQRRLPLKDVLAYKTANRARRRQAPRELAALDQELELE